jgi:hypothetical protein
MENYKITAKKEAITFLLTFIPSISSTDKKSGKYAKIINTNDRSIELECTNLVLSSILQKNLNISIKWN